MYTIQHEQNSSTNRIVSRGTQHDKYVVTGKEVSFAIDPEGEDNSNGG